MCSGGLASTRIAAVIVDPRGPPVIKEDCLYFIWMRVACAAQCVNYCLSLTDHTWHVLCTELASVGQIRPPDRAGAWLSVCVIVESALSFSSSPFQSI